MQLLRDALTPHTLTRTADGTSTETLDDSAQALWEEYERASKGRRQLTWSQSLQELRKELTEISEQSDEEIAEEDLQRARTSRSCPSRRGIRSRTGAMEFKYATEDSGRQGCWD